MSGIISNSAGGAVAPFSMLRLTAVIRHSLSDVVITAALRGGVIHVSRVRVGSRAESEIAGLNTGAFRNAPRLKEICNLIAAFLNGTETDLSGIPVDPGDGTAFRAAVLAAACRIPYATTVTYGELAAKAGFPGAVRAAASVMRRNTLPLLIPCHRIVRKDGSAGGYCGSQSGGDVLLKERLLHLERRHKEFR